MSAKRTAYLKGSVTAAGDVIGSTTAEAFGSFSLQLPGAAVGTVVVQVSNDGATWVATRMQSVQDAMIIAGAVAPAGMWRGPVEGRFVKVSCTAYTSGTLTAHLFLTSDPFAPVVKST